jgi:hypothetical protein
MKYKNIRSMAHNWSHSFMSDNNYIDGRPVYEDIYRMARAHRGNKVVISWIPPVIDESVELTHRVQKCIEAYRATLAEHLRRHQVDICALVEFRTEVYVAENSQMHVRAFVRDDRGREHVSFVWDTPVAHFPASG